MVVSLVWMVEIAGIVQVPASSFHSPLEGEHSLSGAVGWLAKDLIC